MEVEFEHMFEDFRKELRESNDQFIDDVLNSFRKCYQSYQQRLAHRPNIIRSNKKQISTCTAPLTSEITTASSTTSLIATTEDNIDLQIDSTTTGPSPTIIPSDQPTDNNNTNNTNRNNNKNII